MAFLTLSLAPISFIGGASEEDINKLERDTEDLRGKVPDEIRDDFETFSRGIEDYANALKGVNLRDLLEPETQKKMEDASKFVDAPEMQQASDKIEAYFEKTCPSVSPGAGSGS